MTKAQNTLYDFIKPGEYQVGFRDTIVFNKDLQYEAFGYSGMKPNFIQIWYPLCGKATSPDYLKFKNFLEMPDANRLSTVQLQLKKYYQEAVIRDFIEENLVSGEANDFGKFTYEDILHLIGETETISIGHNDFKSSNFPVIVYHHGSQSFPSENYAMAEYFASRGFIFVASNFHLPYENSLYGLKPFNKIIKGEEEQSLKFILEFAKTLTKSTFVFFIGHSLGAQMGLRTFDEDTTIKGLVSLETTIEFKTEPEKIKEMWPEVFQKVMTGSYPFPILFCAATGQEKPFAFFENINSSRTIFASTKTEFEHNAYLSSFYLRLFLGNNVKQTDTAILQDRLLVYNKQLELINEFINGILKGENKLKNEIIFVRN
ncbi:MAG: hypothetical protein U0T82_11815 [Bacteroidales bacterium]